ncbi:hypothetical protein J6590_039788 [Homalodisca vitripennis]|nr:hypothetical protein J6590_039788 [Homalodisca vitripennis]
MKRANSPLSDNTISRVINEDENFSSDESFLNNFGSEKLTVVPLKWMTRIMIPHMIQINQDHHQTFFQFLSAEWFDFKEQRHPIPDTDVSDDENQGGGDAGILPRFFEKLPNKKERNCCVCSAASTRLGGKRKKSSYICKKCKKGLHTKCFPLHKC